MNVKLSNEKEKRVFWIFGTLQSITLGVIIFLVFKSLNAIAEFKVVGLDTQLMLSILFPLFLLIVEYFIYSKK
jgi:hypothetical protein